MSNPVTDPPRRRRLSVEDYYRMAAAGILLPGERVELIEGEIIDMAPIGARHTATVALLDRILQRAVGDAAIVWVQGPISLGGFSEPEPDLALLRPRADFYRTAHPGAADVLLAIEVAETSLRYDVEIKVPLYARHGVPEVWVVDIGSGRLSRYRDAVDGAYARSDVPDIRAPIAVASLAGVALDLGGLLP